MTMNTIPTWITDLAKALATDTDHKIIDALIYRLHTRHTAFKTLKKNGVSHKIYDQLEGSYEAVRIAVKFLKKYKTQHLGACHLTHE